MTNKKFLELTHFSDVWGNNLLLLAIENNDHKHVKLLIEAGYDLNHVNSKKQNALTIAYHLDDKTILKDILSQYQNKFTVDIKNSLLKLLKSAEMSYLSLYELKLNQEKVYPLHDAVINGDLALIKNLLKEGVDVNGLDALGKPALFNLSYNGFKKQTDFLNLFKLFKEYGYDFTVQHKNTPLSSIVLNSKVKTTQKIFNYMYSEGWHFDVYQDKSDLFRADLYQIIKNIKLNQEQMKKIFVEPVHEGNYHSIPLQSLYEAQDENGNCTHQIFFDILEKISTHNWSVIGTIHKKYRGFERDENYNVLSLIMNTHSHYGYGKDSQHLFKQYLLEKDLAPEQQSHITKIIANIHQKTDFLSNIQFLMHVLKSYSINDLDVHLTQDDTQKSYTIEVEKSNWRDGYDTKEIKLNSILNILISDSYSYKYKNFLTDLIQKQVFNIYEQDKLYREEKADSFLSRIVNGFANSKERHYSYDEEQKMKKACYELFLVICENYTIDLEHTDSSGVSVDTHITNYIQTLRHKEEGEKLLFSIALQKNTPKTKKVKI